MKNVFQHGEPENVCKVNAPRSFTVTPQLPPALSRLTDIAYNLWSVWNSDAFELFRRMDHDLWDEVNHNPITFLGSLSAGRLAELGEDPSFIAHLEDVHAQLTRYLDAQSWFHREFSAAHPGCSIAYFSMEYGIAESLPVYSGGLGILAGDHCKSASDLGVPLIGVGLLYSKGYFDQKLNADGWQESSDEPFDPRVMPLVRLSGPDDSRVIAVLETAAVRDGTVRLGGVVYEVRVHGLEATLLAGGRRHVVSLTAEGAAGRTARIAAWRAGEAGYEVHLVLYDAAAGAIRVARALRRTP